MSIWEDLSLLDSRFLTAVRKIYKTPVQLFGAFDNLQDAGDLVHEMLGAQISSEAVKRIGHQLYSWKERLDTCGPDPVSLLCRSLTTRLRRGLKRAARDELAW